MRKKHKGVTLIELLIVILLIGIFSGFAIPNVNKWIIDRQVKKEVYEFVGEINEMKSKVMGGQYPLAMIRWTTYSNKYASLKKYYMTHEDFFTFYRTTSANARAGCDDGITLATDTIKFQKYQQLADFTAEKIRHWPDIHMCISNDGSKRATKVGSNSTTLLTQNDPVTDDAISRVILCSIKNTTAGGSNRCNDSNKKDYRYLLTWDRFVNIKIYKYSKTKDKWCDGTNCYSNGAFK
jgi:prepilin-type N-terminal cleavage/methylation domain-containing protein